jgi:hypothetical protein
MSGLEVSPAVSPPKKARAKRHRRFLVFGRGFPSKVGSLFGLKEQEWWVDSIHTTLAAANARRWELTARQKPVGLFNRGKEFKVLRRDLNDPTKAP